jgi:translation initiation factor 5A
MKTMAEVRTLKKNGYIVINDEPCRIVDIATSKPGKHGEAKARIEAFGLFDDQRRSIVHPVKHKVSVPIVDRRNAQVISVRGDITQLMDLKTYEMFELPSPKGTLESGREVQYIVAMGKRKITRV